MSRLLPITALVLLAAAAGTYMIYQQKESNNTGAPELIVREIPQTDQRIDQLMQRIEDLESRIAYLEAEDIPALIEPENMNEVAEVAASIAAETLAEGNSAPEPKPLIDGLIAAGLDPYRAEELARVQGEVDMRRLELRDQALRDGYIGSDQFREEMREISANQVDIKSEVNEDIYDRYLFHTGQNNRLQVESVILGSTAEDIGLAPGDYIVSYENEKLFDWSDLRGATSSGERGELVSLTITRAGSDMTLSLPRGPLGVRLNAVRIDPDG